MTRRLAGTLGGFARAEGGVVAAEFALLFPFMLFLFVWVTELGLLMTKSVILEHALDVTMRELRLGNMANPTSVVLKEAICARARILGTCRDTITIELQPIDTNTWALPPRDVACRDRDQPIEPVVNFTIGQQNEIMLVRACVIVDPMFPGTGIGAMLAKDPSGGFGMVALSAFVNEPT